MSYHDSVIELRKLLKERGWNSRKLGGVALQDEDQATKEERDMRKHAYNLVELTEGPWKGEIHRTENLTEKEAKARNARMSGSVMEWRKAA